MTCRGVFFRKLTDISHLGHGKVLADADPRPAVEGHIRPRLGGPVLPPLGAVDGRVGKGLGDLWVDVFATLHGQGAVDDNVALEHGDGRLPVGAGQARVLKGGADVVRHGRVDAQRLVDDVRQVLELLEVLIGRLVAKRAHHPQDLLPQPLDHLWLVAELVDGPRQGRRRGVSSGQQHRHDLVADHLAVARVACNVVQEGKVLVRLGQLLELVGRQGQGLLDEWGHELLNVLDSCVVPMPGEERSSGSVEFVKSCEHYPGERKQSTLFIMTI